MSARFWNWAMMLSKVFFNAGQKNDGGTPEQAHPRLEH
jgi:hypothetical protein